MMDLFYAMDTDLNGMLDVEEFREAMRKVLLPSLFTKRCFTGTFVGAASILCDEAVHSWCVSVETTCKACRDNTSHRLTQEDQA